MIKIACLAKQFSRLNDDRGWLLGEARTTKVSAQLEALASVKVAAATGDQRLLDRVMEVARPVVERPMPTFADDDWDFVSEVSEDTLRAFLILPHESAAAVTFFSAHGVFREEDTRRPKAAPAFVRKFWTATERKGKRPVALELKALWHAQEKLRVLLEMHTHLHRDTSDGRDQANALAQQLGHDSPEIALTWELTLPLANRVLVSMDFEGTQARPVLQTQHVLPGLHSLVWRGFLKNSPLGTCLKCGDLFEMTRPRKSHCSPNCRTAHKQARYRERQQAMKASRSLPTS